MAIQSGANYAAQHSFAFAVNDVYLSDASLQTFVKVRRHQIFHVFWGKSVQIEYAVNRKLDRRFINDVIIEILILSHLFNNAYSRRIDEIVVFLTHFSICRVASVDVYSK